MLLLGFLGGLLTIASPCILPVVPLDFSRGGRSFGREMLPMLLGLAAAFALAASIGTATAKWLLDANEAARIASLALFALVGVTLISPRSSSPLHWELPPCSALYSHSARVRSHASSASDSRT
jgi:cytochrome c biogenesis protein CcdA